MDDSLTQVVTKFLDIFPGRILVFGRHHMARRAAVEKLKKGNPRLDFYFINNSSQDDPFMLFIALLHPKTYILSNDLFRDHVFLMDDPMFERWLFSRLISIPGDLETFVVPPVYEVTTNVSEDKTRIHIPFGSLKTVPYAQSNSIDKIKWIYSQSH